MKKLIVGNWKLNPGTKKEAVGLFSAVKRGIAQNLTLKNAQVVICPPFVYIPILTHLTSKTLTVGGQNVFYEEQGAFTGEISPIQLYDLGVKYVIVGHSEVRKHLNETDEIINRKIKECLKEGLRPILCIGENIGEDKKKTLKRQITEGLKNISNFKFQISNFIIAYEPVWAIGTGKNCSIKETELSIALIRKIIAELYDQKTAKSVRVLYGGSVNGENSADYLKNRQVQGLLIGGASLDAGDFIKIVKSAR